MSTHEIKNGIVRLTKQGAAQLDLTPSYANCKTMALILRTKLTPQEFDMLTRIIRADADYTMLNIMDEHNKEVNPASYDAKGLMIHEE